MEMLKYALLGLSAIVAVSGTQAAYAGDMKQDKVAISKQAHEVKKDAKTVRHERREVRKSRKDVKKDRMAHRTHAKIAHKTETAKKTVTAKK